MLPIARSLRVRPVAGSSSRCEHREVSPAFAPERPIPTPSGVHASMAMGVVLALALAGWVPHLADSLWLDETLTYWVIRDGLSETLDRALHYQPQPAYYVFMWFWTRMAGTSEIALRLPSLIAALVACTAIARLGSLLTRDRETGLLAAVVLASSWNVYRESVDARSYMMGLALLLVMALAIIRWTREGRWRDAWASGLIAALLPQFHLFFVLTYPAFAVHLAMRRDESRIGARQVGLVGLLLFAGALLYLPVWLELQKHGGSYSFVERPTWRALFEVFVWGAPVVGLLAGLCLSSVFESRVSFDSDPRGRAVGEPIESENGMLLALWMLIPLLVLFGVSMILEMSVFLGRYLIPAIPAVCIFYAMALGRIAWGPARVVAMIVMVAASFVANQRPQDDFRGAAAAVDEFVAGRVSTPVLFASGLIEGADEAWLRDPVRARYLLAPTEYYPLAGKVEALPRRLPGHPMAREITDPILRTADRFAVVEWYGNGARVMQWLARRAEAEGFRVVRRSFGGVRVAFFRFAGGGRRR